MTTSLRAIDWKRPDRRTKIGGIYAGLGLFMAMTALLAAANWVLMRHLAGAKVGRELGQAMGGGMAFVFEHLPYAVLPQVVLGLSIAVGGWGYLTQRPWAPRLLQVVTGAHLLSFCAFAAVFTPHWWSAFDNPQAQAQLGVFPTIIQWMGGAGMAVMLPALVWLHVWAIRLVGRVATEA